MSNIHVIMIVAAALAAAAVPTATAQPAWECGTGVPQQDPLLARGITYPYPHSIESAVINVRVHDLMDLQGNGDLTLAEIEAVLDNLQAFYAGIVQFRLVEIVDTPVAYYDVPLIFLQRVFENTTSDALDIILTDPNHPLERGQAQWIPATAFFVSGPIINSNVVAHEMGHCLGLFHTFETMFCAESPDGSNCTTCGDMVCDTAACPAPLWEPYTDPQTCSLTAAFYAIYPDYDPDPTNVMVYAPTHCLDTITPEQADRLLAMIEFAPELQPVIAHSQHVFDNRSSETGLSYVGTPYSAVGIDYFNEGTQPREYEDLFVTIPGLPARLFQCRYLTLNGVPFFEDKTFTAFGPNPPYDLRGASHADFDNDGDLDLFVAGGILQSAQLFQNDGDGTFTDVSSRLGTAAIRANVQAGVWSDYDGDGWVDLYLCRGEGGEGTVVADVLLNNRHHTTAEFTDVTAAVGMTAGNANLTNALGAVWTDVNLDGHPDLFVAEYYPLVVPPAPHARLFIHDGSATGGFTEESQARLAGLVDVMMQMTAVDMADLDNDGYPDLVGGRYGLQNSVVVCLNDGSGYFPASDIIWLQDVADVNGVRCFDQDLDGRMDLLVTSESANEPPAVFRNTTALGATVAFFNDTPHAFQGDAGGAARGLVSLDWNRDGDQDLFVGRATSTDQFYYRTTRIDGTDHPDQDAISVRVASPQGVNNAAGIGARVSVGFGTETLVKWVDGGSSRGGQNDLVLTFPVDQSSGNVPVAIVWPNGWLQSAQVPVHTPGDAPQLVLDDTNPTVQDATVSAYAEYDPVEDLMTFVFTWSTEYGSDPAMDKVTFGSVPSQCDPGLTQITPATSGATHTQTRLATGAYQHELRWTGWECVPNCTIPYTVTSGHRTGITSTSTQKTLKFRFCPSSL